MQNDEQAIGRLVDRWISTTIAGNTEYLRRKPDGRWVIARDVNLLHET